MFSGQDSMCTVEHISRFLIQCGEVVGINALKTQMFLLSLSGSSFAWFSSLPANSIITWADLEMQFDKYSFAGVHEMKRTDLTAIRQRNDKHITDYVQRFGDIRSRCFILSLSNSHLAELAFQGLLPHIKERFSSQEFEILNHLAQRLACVDVRAPVQGRTPLQKKINFAGDSFDSDESQSHACLLIRKRRHMGLMLQRPTGSSIYFFRSGRSNCLQFIGFRQLLN